MKKYLTWFNAITNLLIIAAFLIAAGDRFTQGLPFSLSGGTVSVTGSNSLSVPANLDITDGTDTYRQLVSSDKWVLQNDAGTPLDLIRADSTGNLEIAPTITDPQLTIGSTGADATLAFGTKASINANNQFTIRGDANNTSTIMFQTKTAGQPTNRMEIANDGSVILGTTVSAQGTGSLNADSIFVNDVKQHAFVFEKEYKTIPISELESFYKKNKTIPTMAKIEDEFEKRKPPVGRFLNALYETVEVQAVYIAELERRIRRLERQ